MDDLREEIGMQFSLTGRLVRSQMMWAGHLMRMEAGRLPKRVEAVKEGGHRKRGRPQWEDCIKRDVKRQWRKKAVDREQWKITTTKAVQQN